MPDTPDAIFRTLADPTRHAIFDRLVSDGERTVSILTNRAGASRPAVSKHLAGTLRPAKSGTLLRMEQSSFRPEQPGNYQGAKYGRQKYFSGLERVVAGMA
jgi:DNA-binding transcriptional ArsR family regulator